MLMFSIREAKKHLYLKKAIRFAGLRKMGKNYRANRDLSCLHEKREERETRVFRGDMRDLCS